MEVTGEVESVGGAHTSPLSIATAVITEKLKNANERKYLNRFNRFTMMIQFS
jgi:hypothetical protein